MNGLPEYQLCLSENPFNAKLYYTQSTGSTMIDASRWKGEDLPFGSGLIAGFQNEGRGRGLGRSWESDAGKSLLATFIFDAKKIEFQSHFFPLFVGLATALFCNDTLGVPVKLCWPNDILYQNKKLAGILCQFKRGIFYFGIGINLNQTDFKGEFRREPVSLFQITNKSYDPIQIANGLLTAIFDLYNRRNWRELLGGYLFGVGERVVFMNGEADRGQAVAGVFLGLDENGQVQIQMENEKVHSFASGEFTSYKIKKKC